MARKRKYTEDEVLKSLRKKNDCQINSKTILVLNGTGKKKHKLNDLGNGSWGRISYLINYCGYRQYYVSDF